MRKKWLFLVLAAMTASVAGCGKREVPDVTMESIYTETEEATSEETDADIEESTEAETDGVVRIDDIRDKTLEDVQLQAKNGLTQLHLLSGFADVDASITDTDIIESKKKLMKSLGISEDELMGLSSQEAINQYLIDKGLNDDEVYAFSIYNYLLEALKLGNDGNGSLELVEDSTDEFGKPTDSTGYTNYYSKTEGLLGELGMDIKTLLNISDVGSISSYVNSASGLSLKELNGKLWINSIFPGVDVAAVDLMDAKTPEEFLAVFTDAGYTTDDLKSNVANEKEADALLDNLIKIEESSKAEEEGKDGKDSGTKTKGAAVKDVADKTEEKAEKETIPDNGGENSIGFIVNGGDFGYGTAKGKASSHSSGKDNLSGHSVVTIGDDSYDVKIVVKEIVRNARAKAYIADSNGNLPGEINTDNIPDDYEWVVVKFVVKSEDDKLDKIVRPLVRVKKTSGGNPEDGTATRVFYIEPEKSNESDGEKTYYVAFWLPEGQEVFTLYFGDSSGSVYKFKSSALEDEDDDINK